MTAFLDIHCHLLPEVDDGAKTVEESLACLAAASQAGIADVVLSRHEMAGVYSCDRDDARLRREALQREADAAGIAVRLHDGAEHYMDDVFLNRLATGPETLAGGAALLVEMPMMRIPHFARDIAFRLRVKGLLPILAHVERYRDVAEDPKSARELADAGFLLQVNLGSLAGLYGRRVAKAAHYMIEHDLADCVGSDVHNTGMIAPCYEDGLRELRKYGDDVAARLMGDNPRRLVFGAGKNGAGGPERS
ncbi:hypothetical protein K8I61_10300 [bacterium]|nr:hypothetical protein [bacterium]